MAEATYRDIDLSLKRHPLSGDIATVTDEAAVKTALRNLVFLAPYDKPFNPEISSPVYGLLFESIDAVTSLLLRNGLLRLIRSYEQRIQDVKIEVIPLADENKYTVNISYVMKKTLNPQTLELFIPVERLR